MSDVTSLLDKILGAKTQSPQPEALSTKCEQSFTNAQVLELCRAYNNPKFDTLWSGRRGMPEYQDDDSDEDFALLGIMRFYTQDVSQLASLFRDSGLFRPPPEKGKGYPELSAGNILTENAGKETYSGGPIQKGPKRKFANPKQEPMPISVLDRDAPALPDQLQLNEDQKRLASTTGKWLEAYVAFGREASPQSPTSLHTALGITVGSLAIARRVYIDISTSYNRIFPNLFLLYLAASGKEKKTTAFRVAKELIAESGMKRFLMPSRQTPEALIQDLTTKIPSDYSRRSIEAQELWLEERTVAAQRSMLLEEASGLFDSFNRDFTSGLLPILLDLYDCTPDSLTGNTIGRGHEVVAKPYLSLFGTTSYGSMSRHLADKVLWANGFFARCSFVGSSHDSQRVFFPDHLDIDPDLVKKLKYVATTLLPLPKAEIEERSVDFHQTEDSKTEKVVVVSDLVDHAVKMSGNAREYWKEYSLVVSHDWVGEDTEISGTYQSSYNRFGTLMAKVATVLAVFDATTQPVVLEDRHMYRAQQIVEQWRIGLHDIFPELDIEMGGKTNLEEKILRKLVSGQWRATKTIYHPLNLSLGDISPVLDRLVKDKVLEERLVRTGVKGRPGKEYRMTVEDF